MMQVFEMIVLIVLIGSITGLIKQYLSNKKAVEVDISGIEKRLDKLESLQKRIETLEAIVTDKGYDLRQEINNLK